MQEEAVFVAQLDPELRAEFLAAVEATHRPASEVMGELIREFVERQREATAYDEFVERKVAVARESAAAGRVVSHEQIQADMARRRASCRRARKRVSWTDRARCDLQEIWECIAVEDVSAANRMDELFDETAMELAEFPRLGRPGRVSGTRERRPHPHCRVIYQIDEDAVVILVHTARQWPQTL